MSEGLSDFLDPFTDQTISVCTLTAYLPIFNTFGYNIRYLNQ